MCVLPWATHTNTQRFNAIPLNNPVSGCWTYITISSHCLYPGQTLRPFPKCHSNRVSAAPIYTSTARPSSTVFTHIPKSMIYSSVLPLQWGFEPTFSNHCRRLHPQPCELVRCLFAFQGWCKINLIEASHLALRMSIYVFSYILQFVVELGVKKQLVPIPRAKSFVSSEVSSMDSHMLRNYVSTLQHLYVNLSTFSYSFRSQSSVVRIVLAERIWTFCFSSAVVSLCLRLYPLNFSSILDCLF